jgi:hypothetical protein
MHGSNSQQQRNLQSAYFEKTTDVQSKEFTFTDYVIVPNYLGLESSQVYWDAETADVFIQLAVMGEIVYG